jgi:hypothetical protein
MLAAQPLLPELLRGLVNTDAAQRSQRGVFLAAFSLLTLFYAWTCLSDGQTWGWGRPQTDHYNLLVHGFLKGHLYLDEEVPKALLDCADPYDPALRPPGAGLHDASLYQGHYYIYHGVAPAALVLLPFRLLSGTDLPLGAAVWLFATAALVPLLALAGSFRRRFFPGCGPGGTLLLALSLGLLNWAPVLLRRYSLYDLPIASGQCFGLAAFYALHRVILSRERRVLWLGLSSLCWGLAVASRPVYLLAPLVLLLPLVWFRNDSRSGAWQGPRWPLLCAALLPIMGIGLGMAWYNQARFGNPLEFGVRYILSGVYESRVQHFSLRYLPWNLGAYFWAPVSWSAYFPFFGQPPLDWVKPAQHFGMDFPFGLLRHLPLLWFVVLLLPVLAFRSPHAGASKLRRVLLPLLWICASVMAFLFCFYAAMLRYVGDFAPWLALLAVVGAMAWVDGLARKGLRWTGVLPVGAACLASMCLAGLLSLQAYGRLSQYNPGLYSAIGDIANRPVYLLQAGSKRPSVGPLLIRLRFPAGVRPGTEELLLSDTGGSRLVLRYLPDGQACLVFRREGLSEQVGTAFPLESERQRDLRLSLGSLFAPIDRPELASLSPAQKQRLRRTVLVHLDGSPVLQLHQGMGDGIASGLYSGAGGFSGEVVSSVRERLDGGGGMPLTDDAGDPPGTRTPDADGWVRFTVRFPAGIVGRREPLLVSGDTGRGDFLAVEYLAGNRVRLFFDHWGRSPYLGPEIEVIPGHAYQVELRHPALVLDENNAQRSRGGTLRLLIDGREFWSVEAKAYPARAEDFYLGENPIGGSSCGSRFSGELK